MNFNIYIIYWYKNEHLQLCSWSSYQVSFMQFHGWFNQMKMYAIASRDGDAFPPSSPSASTCIYVATG